MTEHTRTILGYIPRRSMFLGMVLILLWTGGWWGRCPLAYAALDDLERRLRKEKVDLERIEQELETNNQELQSLKGKEKEIGKEIGLIEQQIALLQEYLKGLRQEEAELERKIEDAEGRLRRAQRRLLRYERNFSQRLVRIYKHRHLSLTELLLSPGMRFSDLLARHRYLSAIAELDRRDFDRVKREKARIERLKAQLRADYEKKLDLDEKTSVQEQALEKGRRSQQSLLTQVQNDINLRRELARELEKDRQRSQIAIERTIEAIRQTEERERAQRAAEQRGSSEVIEGTLATFGDFASKKGKLEWPVKGRVLRQFGRHKDTKLKTWTFNRGIDIQAKKGTEVKAVGAGKAVLVDWFRGYGKFVLLYHGGSYFTLYGCLSEVYVQVGTMIEQGDVIARSGDTGTLGESQLHFEVLKGKEALNPVIWLASSN